MPRLALLVVLLALSLAPRAQTAEHVQVVDAVIEAANLDVTMNDLLGPMLQGLPGGGDLFNLDALQDSLRSRLLADGRTDDLRAVLAFYQSPANATMMAQGREMMEQMNDPQGALDFQQRVAEQDETMLADEALIRRYQRAQGTSEMMPEMMSQMFDAITQASPEFAAMLEGEGGRAMLDDENIAEFTEAQVDAMRVAFYGVPRDVLEQAVTFAESDAGRYFARVGNEVAMDVMVPAFADFMTRMVSGMTMSPADDAEIFDMAEVQPELIGGIEALSEAIVYPENARREGVEGRVIVQFVVDERGGVTDVTVVRSPNELLSEAALAAVRQLRFTPGMDQGRPVKVRFALPVIFRLNDEPEGDQ